MHADPSMPSHQLDECSNFRIAALKQTNQDFRIAACHHETANNQQEESGDFASCTTTKKKKKKKKKGQATVATVACPVVSFSHWVGGLFALKIGSSNNGI